MSVMYDRVTGCNHGLTIAHIACPKIKFTGLTKNSQVDLAV
jgi:hypothetical protein